MKFAEALTKLRVIAAGRHSCIQYGLSTYEGGDTKEECSLYVMDVGWTSPHRSWEGALEAIGKLSIEKQAPEGEPGKASHA